MKIKRFKVKHNQSWFAVDQLFDDLREDGFTISNPDCKSGNSLDLITRGKQKIAGFDLLWDSSEPKHTLLL